MSLIPNKYVIIDYGSHTLKGMLCESGPLGESILRTERLPIVRLNKLMSTETLAARVLYQPSVADTTGSGSGSDGEEEFSDEENQRRAVWREYEYNIIHFVQSFFPEQTNFIIGLPLSNLYIRDLVLPAMKAKPREMAQAIAYEAEEGLPYSLEDIEVVGYPWAIDEENMHVVSFGALRELVSNSVKPILGEQAVVLNLSIDAAMLSCFLQLFKPDLYKESTIGQLHIGASNTILNVVNDAKLSFSRSLAYGGNDLTEIIASALSLDFYAAEKKKLELNIDLVDLRLPTKEFLHHHSISAVQYREILHLSRQWVAKLCLEVERSLLALCCPSPECFYVSGGVALTKGIHAVARENLQKHFETYPIQLSNGQRPEIWAIALGARAQYKLPATQRCNFLGTPFGSTLSRGQFDVNIIKVPFAFLTGALAIFLISLSLGIMNDRSRVTKYQDHIQEYAKGIPGILADASTPAQILTQAQAICGKRLRNVQRSKIKILDLLNEISKRTPTEEELYVKFRKFSFKDNAVELEVELDNVGDSTVVQEKLGTSQMFRNVEAKKRKILPNQKARITYRLEAVEKKYNLSIDC